MRIGYFISTEPGELLLQPGRLLLLHRLREDILLWRRHLGKGGQLQRGGLEGVESTLNHHEAREQQEEDLCCDVIKLSSQFLVVKI